MIHRGNRYPRGLHRGSRKQHVLCQGGRTIYLSPEAARAATKAWLDANVVHDVVIVDDATAKWFELEITLPGNFSGNPADGWTDGTIHLGLFWSETLTSWVSGGWIAAPGKTTVTLGDGREKHFARYATTPLWWMEVMIDLTAVSTRYGKSITGLTIYRTAVSLPNYPYDMPGEASQLQTDLRAAGYTNATVSSVSAALTAGIKNHTAGGAYTLTVTQSGTDVTDVAYQGVTIPLSGYPYSMPSQRATLQTDLRNAGQSGAVVTLYGDEWTIFLPDRSATGNVRDFAITFTPGDPFPFWNFYGEYQGENPDNVVQGTPGNVRTPTGAPLAEALKGFARIGFINIPTPP